MSTQLAPTPKMSLDQIEDWIDGLMELREFAVGEGALPDQLAVIDQQIDEAFAKEIQKCDGIAHARHVWNLAVEDIDAQIERLKDRKKMFQGRIDRLDAATIYALKRHEERTGRKKIETPLHTIRYQGNGGLQPLDTSGMILTGAATQVDWLVSSVTLTLKDWEEIGDALGLGTEEALKVWDRIRPQLFKERVPDNDAIREALKRGEEVPGAKLLPRGEQLRCS